MNSLKTSKLTETKAASRVFELCGVAKSFEDSGEYETAASALGGLWRGVGVRPDTKGLAENEKAAILSRVGALSGWVGSMQQVAGSQEMAKDLISEGATLFEKSGDFQNWAESRSDLAVCYWREGSFEEARLVLEDVLGSDVELSPELEGKILLRSVNVEISSRHYSRAMGFIDQAAPLIENSGSNLLKGKLYFHRALILRGKGEEENNTAHLKAAVEDYLKAGSFYKKAKHALYAANVESNLGNVFRLLADRKSAHSHLDNALRMYVKLKDQSRAALTYDNKARAFLEENNLKDAETAARASVAMLRDGGERSALSESLSTLGVVLSRRNNFAEAVHSFVEAKEAALIVDDRESAGNAVLTQIEELQADLSPAVFRTLYLEADELLKSSPRASTIERLQEVAKKQFEFAGKFASMFATDPTANEEGVTDWENFSLPEYVRKYEGDIILKALNETGGRVTKAAKMLGLSHQNLSLILHQRHVELKKHCVQRKPRTVIKKKN